MIRKYKYIISLLLLIVFAFPSIVKLEHNHTYSGLSSNNEKGFSLIREKCVICSFEFSVFITNIVAIDIQKENPSDNYFISYNSLDNSKLSKFNFLLRAPPSAIQLSTA
jgi:hypothetical protein